MLTTEFPIVTDAKPEQLLNAPLPMLVTEFGITTVVNPVNSAHKAFGMFLTLFPNVKLVMFVSPLNAQVVTF